MSKEFERENRYIVLKRKHLGQLPDELQIRLKPALEDAASLLPKLDYVVVESDWPEYEPTWAAIEARVTGLPAERRQVEPIILTAVADLVDDGDGGLEPSWLLEGGTAELFAGMTLLVAENAPDLCSEDGSAEVYGRGDVGQVERLQAENERLRMQLAACGVVAMSNTPETAAKNRDMHPDYMSASCQDVMRAVDSEMANRADAERWRFFSACMNDDYIEKLDPLMSVLDEAGVDTAEQADAHMDKCIQIARDNNLWPLPKQVAQ